MIMERAIPGKRSLHGRRADLPDPGLPEPYDAPPASAFSNHRPDSQVLVWRYAAQGRFDPLPKVGGDNEEGICDAYD